jgi:acid phosphatase family membrane protein YuiD
MMQLPLFLIPIIVGLITQVSKRFLNQHYLSSVRVQGVPMPRYGGMPSAHTSFAFSLVTVIALTEGVMGPAFAIAATITIFILDDALRMRIFLGRQGQALRQLISKLPPEEQQEYPFIESRLGHKPMEVLAGAIIGIALSLLLLLTPFFTGV